MAVFLWRLAGSPRYNAPYNVFTDVNQYKTQILWLSATRVTSGTGAHYDPNGKVTRGQMAAFLHRMAVSSGNASATAKYDPYFRDAKKHMFANDIGWMKANGIADSCNMNYNPDANVTRGEMAAFLQRFYKAVNLKVNKTSLKVKNSTLYVGDTWKASDNFVSATDKTGKAVGISSVQVRGQVDTTKAGTYTVTYSYGGKTATVTVIVDANAPVLSAAGTEVTFLGKTWSVLRSNDSCVGQGNYLIALQEKIGTTDFKDEKSYFTTNDRDQDGYADSKVKTVIDTWYNQNIKGQASEQYVQPVVLNNPTLGELEDIGVLRSNAENNNRNQLYLSHVQKYRTTVDTTSGVKQAFAMSSADMSNGVQSNRLFGTTNLTPEAAAWSRTLPRVTWLRSAGGIYNSAATIESTRDCVGYELISNPSFVVSVALVVHVP